LALKERPSREDLIFLEILKHPVLSQEFIRNVDSRETDEPFEFTDYQKEMLCDFNKTVSITCGRAVGKTEVLKAIITWITTNNFFNDYIVYSVPNKVHLSPVWDGLVRLFRTNSFLKHFIARNTGINSSDHKITLLNGATLMCRISGNDGTGRNVVGLHTPFFIVDEGGLYEWKSWIELQPTINTFVPGSRLIVSGVPTGLRESNVLYFVDQVSEAFTHHRVSALQNPRYSDEDHQRDIEQYGGKDSEDYKRNVLGQHGAPQSAIFDRSLMEIKQYPVFQVGIDGKKLGNSIQEYLEILTMLAPVPPEAKEVILGVDLGYVEPAVFMILYKNSRGQIKFHLRLQLNSVPYPIQARILDYMDTKYNPVIIGVDEGHTGFSEIQRLKLDRTLLHKNYEERLVPVAFQSNIVLGTDLDGEEIKQKVKPYAINLLREWTNTHRIVYSSSDLDMVTELERMVYTRNPSGQQVYKTLSPTGGGIGDDHNTSALLCGLLAYYLNYEMVGMNPHKKRLLRARWVI